MESFLVLEAPLPCRPEHEVSESAGSHAKPPRRGVALDFEKKGGVQALGACPLETARV